MKDPLKPFRKGFAACLLLLVGLEVALFWRYTAEFMTPDGIYYLARRPESPAALRELFSTLDDVDNYRPASYLIPTLIYKAAGLEPFFYHVAVIALHGLITLLVFWLAWVILRSETVALAAAAFFGFHRAAARVVFGITFISDLTYAALCTFALVGFFKYERGDGIRWYYLSLAAFSMGLLCKEPAITLPVVLLLSLFWIKDLSPGGVFLWRRHLIHTMPFLGVACLYFVWLGLLSKGQYVPREPDHPYQVSFSAGTVLGKQRYLKAAFNLPDRYATMGGHPSISGAAKRFLPDNLGRNFEQWSDFYLYAIGPAWLVWLIASGKSELLSMYFAWATLTPMILISLVLLVRGLTRCLRRGDMTPWFGLAFFLIATTPVLFLAKKTMLHNLYLPVVGLSLMVGYIMKEYLRGDRFRSRVLAVFVSVPLIVAGAYAVHEDSKEIWPVTTSRMARTYLQDVQRLHPELPSRAILYFEKTGNPEWPWLTDRGNLYRLYYGRPDLRVLFGDYDQLVPAVNPIETLIRLGESKGHLVPFTKTAALEPAENRESIENPPGSR